VHRFTPDAANALDGPDWLRSRRTAAAERFAAEPPPDPAAEEWRYSPIRDLDLERYAPAELLDDGPMVRLDAEPAGMVKMANGRVASVELSAELAAAGVTVGPAADLEAGADALGSVVTDTEDHYTVLNDAFSREPILIDVPAGVTIDTPLVVAHHASGDGAAAFPRLVVRLGANAQLTVIDQQTSSDDQVLLCPLVELDVAPAARLGYLNVQQLGGATWQLGSQVARVAQDASLVAASAGFGGSYARIRADTRLNGRGAHGELVSLYFGTGDQTHDYRTYQDHVAPDTTSNLLHKGVVDDRSRSVYTGLIRVRAEARGTNAFQTNRNLKLSDDAWAESVPNLEIENNEVRCSHASTVSPIDEEQRFYLESRGVPTEVADRLIVAGFLGEVMESMPAPAALGALRAGVATKLAESSVAA